MENSDAISVGTGNGEVFVNGNGEGLTEMLAVKETTKVAGGNVKKETIEFEIGDLTKKAKKMMSVPKVVSGETGAADYETAAAAVKTDGGVQGFRIMVSNSKKPLLFYLNLAKRYIMQNNYVELFALGRAIQTAVTIAEILKKDGWATMKDITISSVPLMDDANGRVLMKAKIMILLEKTGKLDKNGLVVAKEACGINENETDELSSETNAKAFENIDQHQQADTREVLAEKKDPQRMLQAWS